MKIEIDIPDDELRTCVSCSSGEMNLTLSLNETIDGYDVTDIVSDTYAGNTSLNFRKVENVGERLIKREMNKTYKVFCIGGDPKKIAFLAGALREKIDDLQSSGWVIDGVDLINNTRAWDSGKQMYVETPEYVIRAKKGDNMAKVYTSDNVCDLRDRLVNAVVEVFGSSEKFLDYIENEEYSKSFYDVFYSGSGECYIINRSTGEYINWYKFTHIGRDIHSTVVPDDFVNFLSDFGFLKGE